MSITDLKVRGFSIPQDLASFVAGGGVIPVIKTGGNVFPMNLQTKTLVLKISTDGGSTYATTRTHTFAAGAGVGGQAGYHLTIAEVVAEIIADAAFMGGGTPDLTVYAAGVELAIKTKVAGNRALKVDATSTGIGAGLLQFLSAQVANGAVTSIVSIIQDSSGQFVLFFL